MKKKLLLMTTLAVTIAATTIPATSALAATQTPEYPTSFVHTLDMSESGLTDYAISGDSYAFAVKTTIYVLSTDKSGDRKLDEFTFGTQITSLDYAEGKLYFKSTTGGIYAYPDVSKVVDHDFVEASHRIEVNDNLYLLNELGELKLFTKTGKEVPMGEGYSSLKKFDNKAYAILDDCPYVLEDDTATPLDLGYTDFTVADKIPTGTARYELTNGGYEIMTATLADDSYYTQIDPESVGTQFNQIRTFKSDGAISCLVLVSGTAKTDELSVIVFGGNCYITATKNLTFNTYVSPANDWKQGPNGQRKAYVREQTGLYASPFMSECTRITTVAKDKPLAVIVEEKFALDFIDTVYYRVSFAGEDGKTVKGFVAAGFLDEYDYSADENKPTSTGTEDFSYENNVTTVILVLVVVGLVIIAIVYLTIVGTKPDDGTKKKRKKDDE